MPVPQLHNIKCGEMGCIAYSKSKSQQLLPNIKDFDALFKAFRDRSLVVTMIPKKSKKNVF